MNTIKNAKAALLKKGRALRGIVDAAETGRVARAANVQFAYAVMRRDVLLGGAIPSREDIPGYEVRIDLGTSRFHCSCDDHGRSGAACKHVAALAVECRKRFWAVMDLMEADAERIAIQITELEAAANSLASKANSALDSSLRALES